MTQGKNYSETSLILAGVGITAMTIIITCFAVLCKKLENEPTEENCEIEQQDNFNGKYADYSYGEPGHFTIRPEQWKK